MQSAKTNVECEKKKERTSLAHPRPLNVGLSKSIVYSGCFIITISTSTPSRVQFIYSY